MTIEYTPIGTIHSPFAEPTEMPIQPTGALGIQGTIEMLEAYREGLKDLDGFSHLILLYHFHHSRGFTLRPIPFLDREPRGLFATRAPKRPNAIGLSVVRLDKIEGSVLFITNVDILDGTPLLDIKPYVPAFDTPKDVRTGWFENVTSAVSSHRSDDRFQ
ncbi:tRNA (N6-threonylcarbamoyladenosine(37)-N6)-methyltransferase TrmO [Thiocapsa rosea]|uniref:tRNA-Thr(GGU) m(6)t(6)A37 methyltransferase TsaA n=1 Tax=Thiocapsa rosea TaxID=69360 RepID=A0A495V7M6_9GAMM|nr:tRNA (N6-threonylcarbamoyladenosine(37)-N6)-methyltransferase TrmO [Thiocapsa rosea]RKT45284.1 tRNA-Thr(GGU) m(6)t(6)A37 methyltransferase TsaA [Thiocapsa rosea]